MKTTTCNLSIWWNLGGPSFELGVHSEAVVRSNVLTMCGRVDALLRRLITEPVRQREFVGATLAMTDGDLVLGEHIDATLTTALDNASLSAGAYDAIAGEVDAASLGLWLPQPGSGEGVRFGHQAVTTGPPGPYYIRDEETGDVVCVYEVELTINGTRARLRASDWDGVANVFVRVGFRPTVLNA